MTREFQPGEVIADRYRIEQTIGAGGMGAVLSGIHVQLGKRVAIKVMLEQADDISLERFHREGQALARLTNPHVCQVTDMGTLATGEPFMVMELMQGQDLQELSDQGRLFRVDELVDHVLAASEALAEAHSHGLVHRDLKPSNLFLSRQADGSEIIKLIDFGIAKAVGQKSRPTLTKTDTLVGSPAFMAPEQLMANAPIDARTDIWAMGVVIYELLARRPAFAGDAIAEIFMSILQAEPAPLHEVRSDVPAGFEHALRRCIRKQPQDRYQNLAEMARSLAPFGSDRAHRSLATIERLLAATRADPALRAQRAATADAASWSNSMTPAVGTIQHQSADFAQLSATIGYETGNIEPPDSYDSAADMAVPPPSPSNPVPPHAPTSVRTQAAAPPGSYRGGPVPPMAATAPPFGSPHAPVTHVAGAHSTTDGIASQRRPAPARRAGLTAAIVLTSAAALAGLFAWTQTRAQNATAPSATPASRPRPNEATSVAVPQVVPPRTAPESSGTVDDSASTTSTSTASVAPLGAPPPPRKTPPSPPAHPKKPPSAPAPPDPVDPIGF